MRYYYTILILLGLSIWACGSADRQSETLDARADLHQSVKELMDVHVFDITSPPLASRSMVYPLLSAYYCYALTSPELPVMLDRLNEWTASPPELSPELDIHPEWAAIAAFAITAQKHVYSQDRWKIWTDSLHEYYRKHLSDAQYADSYDWARRCAEDVIDYAALDGLKKIRTQSKYTTGKVSEGQWMPTPPNYMEPIEPYWGELRPFTLDSAEQYAPKPPTPFDMTEGSPFYREVEEVYQVVNELSEEEREIAAFWDCNPYVVLHKGHFMQPVKKITPGGHWMGITRIACRENDLSFGESLQTYTYIAIALADAFISCWDEKYRSEYIRPETVINTYMDQKWVPVLQTPPFPEYTSGHSVISTGSARVLTHLIGDDFEYVDDVEVEFGLPERQFSSFLAASEEAAGSRIYGGIHFRPAVEEGILQGHKIADQVIQTLTDE